MPKGNFKQLLNEKMEHKAGGMEHSMRPMAGGKVSRMGKGKSGGKMRPMGKKH